MSRYQLDRDATTGERALGGLLVSILALALGIASYFIWVAALGSNPPDPILLTLSVVSAVACYLVLWKPYKTLKSPPMRSSPRALMAAAYVLVVLGTGAFAFAVAGGARTPHTYAAAITSIVMGARYIFTHRRRQRPN